MSMDKQTITYSYTEFYSTIKSNELQIHKKTCMNFENHHHE